MESSFFICDPWSRIQPQMVTPVVFLQLLLSQLYKAFTFPRARIQPQVVTPVVFLQLLLSQPHKPLTFLHGSCMMLLHQTKSQVINFTNIQVAGAVLGGEGKMDATSNLPLYVSTYYLNCSLPSFQPYSLILRHRSQLRHFFDFRTKFPYRF
jgi:hypothetical protein